MKKLDRFLTSDGGTLVILIVGVVMVAAAVVFATGFLLGDLVSGDLYFTHLRSGAWIQAITGITASIVVGLFYYQRIRAYRSFVQYLNVSHKASHRVVSDGYVHIVVRSVLHNPSNVKVEILKGFSVLKIIAPASCEEDIKRMYGQARVEDNCDFVGWPEIEKCNHSWKEDELIIEPGETRTVICQFLRPDDVRTVMVHTFFWKRGFSECSPYLDSPLSKGYANGWGETTVYDID